MRARWLIVAGVLVSGVVLAVWWQRRAAVSEPPAMLGRPAEQARLYRS